MPLTKHLPYAKQSWFKNKRDYVSEVVLTADQTMFIDWMLNPERQGTQADWAKEHGYSPRQITLWKRHKGFIAEWERRAKEIAGGPEAVNMVVQALFQAAVNGDVKAMDLYLRYVDKYTPKSTRVTETKPTRDMSDEELEAQLLEAANVVKMRKGA